MSELSYKIYCFLLIHDIKLSEETGIIRQFPDTVLVDLVIGVLHAFTILPN